MVQPSMYDARVREKTSAFTLATWEQLAILIWRDGPTVAGIEKTSALLHDLSKQWPTGVALLVVIPPNSPRPDELTRAAMIRAVKERHPGMRGMVTIYEGTGFVASLIRSVHSGLQMVLPSPIPMAVFHHAGDAGPWLARILGGPQYTAARVIAVIEEVRLP